PLLEKLVRLVAVQHGHKDALAAANALHLDHHAVGSLLTGRRNLAPNWQSPDPQRDRYCKDPHPPSQPPHKLPASCGSAQETAPCQSTNAPNSRPPHYAQDSLAC